MNWGTDSTPPKPSNRPNYPTPQPEDRLKAAGAELLKALTKLVDAITEAVKDDKF